MDDTAIKVENLSKTFKLPHEKYSSVKSLFINFYKRKRSYEVQHALRDVSFEVKKGEFFGIIGRNGSGKSTLLKLIAGIYTPTKGDIKTNGSLTPFIELGVGFNDELTGRENVFLNGALLGFNRMEMNAMYKSIVEFAELEKFMDQKLKNYSSGMQVRLAFSIAIRARSDILLLDEVLAVGDAAFQQKCINYFVTLKKEKKTIVLVSHNMQTIEQFCDRVLFIEAGEVCLIGDGAEVSRKYEEMFLHEEIQKLGQAGSKRGQRQLGNKTPVEIVSIKTRQNGKEVKDIEASKDFEVEICLKAKEGVGRANVGINIKNRDKVMLVSTDTLVNIGEISLPKNEKKTVAFTIENVLTNGLYTVNIGVADWSGIVPQVLARQENASEFTVRGIEKHAQAVIQPQISAKLADRD